MQRLALGPGHVGKLLGLAQHAHRLVRDLLAERGEAHHAPRALDQRHAEQRLELAQAGGSVDWVTKQASAARRNGRAPQRDQILQLFEGRQMDDHLIEKFNQ